jgi:hypothetical protein
VGVLEGRAKRFEAELLAYRDSERVARTLGMDRFERGLEVRTRRHERALLAVAAGALSLLVRDATLDATL